MSLFKSFYANNNTNSNKTNSNKTNSSNNNVNKNVNKKITNALKIPEDKYVFYDKYLENVPDDVKKHFKEPIGL